MMPRRKVTRIEVSADRGVFMISVAAELAEMHPQTLRLIGRELLNRDPAR
jgi:hypothetical protein